MDTPSVRVFDILTPTNAAVGDFELRYESLDAQLDEFSITNAMRARDVWEAPSGSVEEEQAARRLAAEYFVKTAGKLALTKDTEHRNLWTERYNEAATELYAAPKRLTVMELMVRERDTVRTAVDNGLVSPSADLLLKTYDRILPANEHLENAQNLLSAAEITKATEGYKAELLARYGEVFDLIPNSGKTHFSPDDLKELFEGALQLLQENHGPGWDKWKVVSKDSRILSVNISKRQIEIGKNRSRASADKARDLLAHELFVHALRGNNSYLTEDEALVEGLTGFDEIEEGLGKFAEHAVSGTKPPSSANHYVDIGLALGVVNGEQLNRHQIFELAIARKIVRSQLDGDYDELTLSKLLKQTAASVDRIFYGAPGDTLPANQAVFIKETSYYGGYRKALEYIVLSQREGKNMAEIFDFINSARIDPTNLSHVKYMKDRNNE